MQLTAEEQADVETMIKEFDEIIGAAKPGARFAWRRLKQLASTTDDEWVTLARQYLAERAACPVPSEYGLNP